MHHLTNSGVYDTMEEAGGAAMKENKLVELSFEIALKEASETGY